jgi:hypothetical protein
MEALLVVQLLVLQYIPSLMYYDGTVLPDCQEEYQSKNINQQHIRAQHG